ncbi:MAG: hypothetical protein JJT89_17970 [Nitriliruptoraceae bacterium]|nr:hypothetical protein [Nitriliruptoraceae bacterium]
MSRDHDDPRAASRPAVRPGADEVGPGAGRGAAEASWWRRVTDWHDALFVTKWRSALQREARSQQDAFVAVLYLTAFGIDDPAAYHTLPVTAELIDGFHDWHQRQGLDTFPHAGVCC